MGGVRALRDALEGLAGHGSLGSAPPRLRLLTTVFTGTTEVEAVDALARLQGAEVRVSFDTKRSRLHAKAWLFVRPNQLSTAYVGSANFTATALGAGHEWMLKVSATDLGHIVDHFGGTFETLWADSEFERYDPDNELQRARLRAALRNERRASVPGSFTLLTLQPFAFQLAILERLEAERAAGHRRNLVVAATGTGKTVIAACDYARRAREVGVRPRLLFLAHRRWRAGAGLGEPIRGAVPVGVPPRPARRQQSHRGRAGTTPRDRSFAGAADCRVPEPARPLPES